MPLIPLASPQGSNMKAYELAKAEVGTVEWKNGDNPKVVARVLARCVQRDSGCLIWQGNKNRPNGYGRLRLSGKMVLAHRAVWSALNGTIPAGGEICHSCDTPLCCNPAHLFLGNHATNMRDMAAKGRAGVHLGVENVNAKLRPEDIVEMRRMAESQTQRDIAELFGVNQATVWSVLSGKTWSHVT